MYTQVDMAQVRSRRGDRYGYRRASNIGIRPRQSKPIPEMEDEETPEETTLVALPREMLADEKTHRLRSEDAHRSDAFWCERVQQLLSELLSKPVPERNPEALLGPVHYR